MKEPEKDSGGRNVFILYGGMTLAFVAFLLVLRSGIDSNDTLPSKKSVINPEPINTKPVLVEWEAEEDIEQILKEALTEEAPTVFLETGYEPLAKWFDEDFEIKYKNMTLELIFDQVPLNDIHYNVADLPKRTESFELTSGEISRRELLKKMADHWNLKMDLVLDDTGTPTEVRVTPR